jgi:cobalamin 5'-phosphate synthase/cobalamin synthase
MKSYLGGVLADIGMAWRLLTVLPLPFGPDEPSRPAGRAAAYFPLVGLVLGAILAGAGQLLYLLLPEGLAAGLLLLLWVTLTGMLHLDGLMDSCDGLLPPRDPARRLEIMKDSRVGAFGVIGAILLLLLKFNGLLALNPTTRWPALIVIPALARWAMTWSMARYPLARPEGLSVFFGRGLGWPQVGLASLIAGSAAVISWDLIPGLLLWGLTWLAATLIAQFALARIHGLTGDVYGAICELVELLLLVGIAAGLDRL